MSKKIIDIGSDEDGETYYIIGEVTRLGAFRAILKFMKEDCGLDEEYFPKQEDLKPAKFTKTKNAKDYYEDFVWWGKPTEGVEVEPYGKGWIYSI